MGGVWSTIQEKISTELRPGSHKDDSKRIYHVLVVGHHRHGKSSFINTVNHTVNWDEHRGYYYPITEVFTGNSGHGTTTIRHFKKAFSEKGFNFFISDMPGIKTEGDVEGMSSKLFEGIEMRGDDIKENSEFKVDCVVFCVAADADNSELKVCAALNKKLQKELQGLSLVYVITKIDKVAANDLETTIDNVKSQVGMSTSTYPLFNYHPPKNGDYVYDEQASSNCVTALVEAIAHGRNRE